MNAQSPEELIICPNSEDRWFLAAEGYVLHRASRAEISANGGVCNVCKSKFRKNPDNARALNGLDEKPAVFDDPSFERREYAQIINEVNHTAPETHAITEFDYDEVDKLLGSIEESEPYERAQAAEIFGVILRWVWTEKSTARSAALRFITLCAGIRPDLVEKSYQEIGDEFGITKAAISKTALQIQDALGLKFTRSRNFSQRNTMAVAQLGNTNKHLAKRK